MAQSIDPLANEPNAATVKSISGGGGGGGGSGNNRPSPYWSTLEQDEFVSYFAQVSDRWAKLAQQQVLKPENQCRPPAAFIDEASMLPTGPEALDASDPRRVAALINASHMPTTDAAGVVLTASGKPDRRRRGVEKQLMRGQKRRGGRLSSGSPSLRASASGEVLAHNASAILSSLSEVSAETAHDQQAFDSNGGMLMLIAEASNEQLDIGKKSKKKKHKKKKHKKRKGDDGGKRTSRADMIDDDDGAAAGHDDGELDDDDDDEDDDDEPDEEADDEPEDEDEYDANREEIARIVVEARTLANASATTTVTAAATTSTATKASAATIEEASIPESSTGGEADREHELLESASSMAELSALSELSSLEHHASQRPSPEDDSSAALVSFSELATVAQQQQEAAGAASATSDADSPLNIES